MFGLVIPVDVIVITQSILLIISAILIIIAAIGVLSIDRNMPNVVYARIHILGLVDIAGVIAFLGLGQPLFALVYLILAPFLAHAMSNAYFHTEDGYNNSVIKETNDGEPNSDNVAISENKEFDEEESDDVYSVSTLKINEDD
ncbi:MAG: cation:proton antiporter [Methanobrevibacter ruminantium]|uniref:cation:proton antiporter n=1 Tax=Methanobrevibacter ruminantium TaxID=83816 RepID=UPI0026ED01C6|nr:cation:proton antiporter [Methanobrevibacter ruminantium]MDO5843058.1 cation:proton antiporter [Methanobrevibacter ruminantium]